MMRLGGNKVINAMFEAKLKPAERKKTRPDNHTDLDSRSAFIYDKYQHHKWYNGTIYQVVAAAQAQSGDDGAIEFEDLFSQETMEKNKGGMHESFDMDFKLEDNGDAFSNSKDLESDWFKDHVQAKEKSPGKAGFVPPAPINENVSPGAHPTKVDPNEIMFTPNGSKPKQKAIEYVLSPGGSMLSPGGTSKLDRGDESMLVPIKFGNDDKPAPVARSKSSSSGDRRKPPSRKKSGDVERGVRRLKSSGSHSSTGSGEDTSRRRGIRRSKSTDESSTPNRPTRRKQPQGIDDKSSAHSSSRTRGVARSKSFDSDGNLGGSAGDVSSKGGRRRRGVERTTSDDINGRVSESQHSATATSTKPPREPSRHVNRSRSMNTSDHRKGAASRSRSKSQKRSAPRRTRSDKSNGSSTSPSRGQRNRPVAGEDLGDWDGAAPIKSESVRSSRDTSKDESSRRRQKSADAKPSSSRGARSNGRNKSRRDASSRTKDDETSKPSSRRNGSGSDGGSLSGDSDILSTDEDEDDIGVDLT